MNPKKRKAEDDDTENTEDQPAEENENETAGNNETNSGVIESGNETDQEKPDNGASSETPSTSDVKVAEDDSKQTTDQSTDQREKKQIVDTITAIASTHFGSKCVIGNIALTQRIFQTFMKKALNFIYLSQFNFIFRGGEGMWEEGIGNLRLEGSQMSGELLFCGGTNWDLIGRKELPKNAKDAVGKNLWGPHRILSLQGIKVTSVFAGSCAVHSVIIIEGGQAFTWGRNDKGQLGHCDNLRRDIPTVVETLKEHTIVSASCGRGHTLFLSDRGIVYSCGDNKMGQCGIGSQNTAINIPTKVTFKGRSITNVACGAEFSCIVDCKGGVYSFGCPEYGQLGHNSDGRYFVTSNKLSFRCELTPRRIIAFIEKTREGHVSLVDDVRITSVACGINHTVALDEHKRCFSWGFGGYGRLGHAEQKDELVPRLIKAFDGPKNVRGVKKVFAGGTYSMAVNEHDVLFFWGQNKRAGEATMYPKPVQDLVGWSVRDVGCSNCSIVCVADESVISWGPSPTYGELGYGENRPKSSTTPQEVKPLDDIHIHSVACGYGHTMLIAQNDTEEDIKRINLLPQYTP